MKKQYNSEIEGMIEFYQTLGQADQVDYDCNTDGSIKGCLLEFKLNFTDLLAHKKQVARYLKAYNSLAKRIPEKVLLVDLNNRKFIDGVVSTTKTGATVNWSPEQKHWETPSELVKFFVDEYCKGWIEEESVISYNNLFCEKNGKKITSKEDVRDEFLNPRLLPILPFDWHAQLKKEKQRESKNDWLTFNMNMLGSAILKKQLGAFFTPDRYVKISTQYVRNAIKKVPIDMDYVILDRCAGTGNLEKYLTEEELSHCILNTLDYTEWTTLKGLYEDRVRHILPHDSTTRDDKNGLMGDGDALLERFYEHLRPLLQGKYIIMLENPPFAGTAGIRGGGKGTLEKKKYSYINLAMKAQGYDGNLCKDLLAQFVWSAFEIVKCNEYILYGPVMWWKSNHILDKEYIVGHMCNKKHFNATESGILLGHWANHDKKNETLECFTDTNDETYTIKKKTTFITNLMNPHKISIDKTSLRTPEKDELGLLFSTSSSLDALNGGLFNRETYRTELVTSAGLKMTKLTKANIKKLSVIQCVNCYKPGAYHEKEVVMKCADKGDEYTKDTDLLNDSLLFVLLSDRTKCISNGSLNNQLCLSQKTIGDKLLTKPQRKHELVTLWEEVLSELKKCKNDYNPKYKYGLYQVQKLVNVKMESGSFTKTGEPIKVLKYPLLDERVKALIIKLEEFYDEKIKPKLFKHELLK